MKKRLMNAREIFFHYNGSKFHMQRDEYLDKYLAFKVPRWQEKIWIEELQEYLYQAIGANEMITNEFHNYISIQYAKKSYDFSKKIIEIYKTKEKSDTFTKLLILESAADCLESYPHSLQCQKKVCDEIVKEAKKLISSTITINEKYLGILAGDILNNDYETYIKARLKELYEKLTESK